MLPGSTVNICFVKWRNRPTIKKKGFENRSEIVVIFSAKQRIYEINLEQSLILWSFFLNIMVINKPFSDKTIFSLLTNNNDPNYQFHLPFLSLMPYPLKWCLQCIISIKKKVTSGIVDMVIVANCYKLSLVKVQNFQTVPSKSGVSLCLQKVLFNTLDKIHWAS